MRQLQLFTTAQLATMRDRTASRNYSEKAEKFRRDHERRRRWGLIQRHAERLRRLRGEADAGQPAGDGRSRPGCAGSRLAGVEQRVAEQRKGVSAAQRDKIASAAEHATADGAGSDRA